MWLNVKNVTSCCKPQKINRKVFPKKTTQQIVEEQRDSIATTLRSEQAQWTAWKASEDTSAEWFLPEKGKRGAFRGTSWGISSLSPALIRYLAGSFLHHFDVLQSASRISSGEDYRAGPSNANNILTNDTEETTAPPTQVDQEGPSLMVLAENKVAAPEGVHDKHSGRESDMDESA